MCGLHSVKRKQKERKKENKGEERAIFRAKTVHYSSLQSSIVKREKVCIQVPIVNVKSQKSTSFFSLFLLSLSSTNGYACVSKKKGKKRFVLKIKKKVCVSLFSFGASRPAGIRSPCHIMVDVDRISFEILYTVLWFIKIRYN